MKQNIFFSSDSHYGHANICRGTSTWDHFQEGSSHQGTRDFATLEQMNDALVNGINNHVGEQDVLYHLGDWSFGGLKNIFSFRDRIKCRNIHFILGNHDLHIVNKRPDPDNPERTTQDLFASVQTYLEKSFPIPNYEGEGKIPRMRVCMQHFSQRVWNKSHHGAFHLFGHSHGTLDEQPWGRSMDVGVDSAHRLLGEYRPFSWEEVYNYLSLRDVKIIDHHNEHTN